MYESFYGLSEKPFSLTPDPAFLFLGRNHSVGLTMLQYGIENRAGITVLTGEIGSGKTTLIRRLLDDINDELVIGLISNTHAAFGNLMQWIAMAFDLDSDIESKATLYDNFTKFLVEQYAAGKRTVLVVDEAQNLDAATLEELRLVTNINADKDQVLQLILVGQPELRDILRGPGLTQFVQRVGVDFHLSALSAAETDDYIRHRLNVAGGNPDLFSPVARRFVHLQCEGVPRRINSLCDTALVYGFADSASVIDEELIAAIATERVKDGLLGAGLLPESGAGKGTVSEATIQDNLNQARSECAMEATAECQSHSTG